MNKKRLFIQSSIAFSGVVVAFFFTLFFLLLTQTGFRLLLNGVEKIAPYWGMSFSVDSAQGSFSHELKIAELFWEYPTKTTTKRVKLKNLKLVWQPLKLSQLPPHLVVETLSIESIFVDFIAPENPPPKASESAQKPINLKDLFPEESHLPIRFEIKEFKVGEFFWQQERLFHNAQLALTSATESREKHTIENFRVFYDDLEFSISGEMAAKKPFAFTMKAAVNGNLQNLLKTESEKNLSLTADLTGSLKGIEVNLKSEGALQAEGAFLLNPLAVQALEKGFLNIAPVTLKEWGIATPATLNAQLHVIQKNQQLQGTVFVGNTDKTLPIKSVSGNFALDKNFGVNFTPLHVFFFDNAGKITANGHFKKQIYADLQISTVNLQKFSKSLPPTNLNGKIVLKGTTKKTRLEVAISDSQAKPPLMLQTQALYENDSIAFKSFLLEYGAGKMTMAGKLQLKGAQQFDATVDFANFDFKEFVANSRLNGKLHASGKLSPLEVATNFDLNNSQLLALPLIAKGNANLTPTALKNADISLLWGKNTLAIQGTLTQKGNGLLKIESKLADLNPLGYRGAAAVNAEISGNWESPQLLLRANSKEINNKSGFLLQDLSAQFKVGGLLDSPVESQITIKQLNIENTPQLLRELDLKLSGTNRAHQIRLKTRLPKREYLDFDVAGGFQTPLLKIANARDIWAGTINLLNYYHRTRGGYQIQKGNTIAVGANHWKVENLNIKTQDGSKFAFKVPFEAHFEGYGNAQKTTFSATLENQARKNKIDLSAELTNAKTPWVIADSAPWHIKLNADIAQMAWLSESLGENWELDGTLNAHLALKGSPKKPLASGTIQGSALKLAQNDWLLNLFDGTLDLTINQNVLQLKEFFWKSGLQKPPPLLTKQPDAKNLADLTEKPGSIRANGHLRLMTQEEDNARLNIQLDRFGPVQQADQWLILSGNAEAHWEKESLAAKGDLKIDAGFWQIKGFGSPSLSSDVVVRKTLETQVQPKKIIWQPRVTLNIDMGRHFMFTGYGLSTLLDGRLKIIAEGHDLPRAEGTINTRGGRFEAYGQRLMIRRGRLNFENLINNPTLDVEAFRLGGKISSGVKISGTVERPEISLISEPNVPDAEKLSWLVLGHGPEDMSMGDAALLVSAADGLLGSSSGGIISQMRTSIGIDEFNISQGDVGGNTNKRRITSRVVGSMQDSSGATNDQILTIGKRITNRMRLVYEQSLGQADSLLRLFTRMKYGVMFIVGTGSDTSLDFFYRYVRGLPPRDSNEQNNSPPP